MYSCECYLSNPFGVLSEENFKGMELLRNSFDVVKPVNTDYNPTLIETALQLTEPLLHGGVLEALDKLPRVDTNGERPHLSVATFKLDAVRLSLQPEDSSAGRQEVASVVVSVEAYRQRSVEECQRTQ